MSAGPYSEETLWTADINQMILQPFEDVTIAFHKISGDTHILNFLSAATIKVLAAGDETFTSASSKILDEIHITAADCPEGLIADTILQLDDVGLVNPRNWVP